MSPGEWAFIMMPLGTNNRVHFVSPARGNNGADGSWRRREEEKKKQGGGLRETASRNPSAILTLCRDVLLSSYKAAPGKKKTSASSRKGGSAGEGEGEEGRGGKPR